MSLHAAQIDPETSRGKPRSIDELRADLQNEVDRDLLRVERKPDDVEAWKALAINRARLGLYNDAVDAFDHAAGLDPDADDLFWYGMAVAATRSGNYKQALRAFEKLTQLHPDQPVEWIFKSMALTNLGKPEQAEAALRQAAELDATDPAKIVAIAFALGLLGRYDEALALDEEAIRQTPPNPHAYANKGSHLAKKSQLDGADPELVEEADRAFRRAVELAPGDATILRNYGVMLGEVHRYKAAREQLEQARAIVPNNVATLRSLGFVLTKLGDHEGALAVDTKAVELAPLHAVAWRSKGVDLMNLGRYEEALHAFRTAAGLTPDRAEMWQAEGSALWRLGQYTEAAEAFERVTLCDGTSADAWLGLGASRDALGQHAAALEDLRKAVGTGADRPELWASLGRTYRNLGNTRAAEQAFRRGFQIEPSMVMASGVIDALAAQEREQEALDFLAGAPPDDRDEALIAYWRGVLLTRLGRESEAIAEFRAAARAWKSAGVQDARATSAAHAAASAERRGGGAVSWNEHWFGRDAGATTRFLGGILLCALLGALILPLAGPDTIASLDYGAGWAAITLPVTVLVLLLALPTVQSIKAGGGSFEMTTIVLSERDPLALSLPSEIRIDKLPDLPAPDARDALAYFTDLVGSFLDEGSAPNGKAERGAA